MANSLAIGSLRKGVNQIVHGRIGIARCKWREIESEFEQLQNRNGFVFSVIDITVACQWRDDNSRDTNTCAPTVVSHRRRNVMRMAAAGTIVVVFEYEVDREGNTRSEFWEWK